MEKNLFNIIIAVIIFDYVFDRVLDYLNSKRLSHQIPEALRGIYDDNSYRKSQDYLRVNLRFGAIKSSISFVVIILFLLSGGFQHLDTWVRQITEHPVLMALLFLGVIGVVSDLLSTPLDVYDTFVIEEKFGFNRTTVSTYISDKIKGWFLAILIGGGILIVFIWFYQVAGHLFWLYAWLFMTGISIVMVMFYSTLIVPLFNKQVPLESGDLRDAIQEFAMTARFKLDNIFVIDGSKRSSKANAYFSGLGPKKRIVLYDTLIKEHTKEELVAILAHEIGHYKKRHVAKGMIVSAISSAFMFYLLGLFINRPELSLALGVEQGSIHVGLIAFGLLYSPVSLVLGIAGNYMSRRHEFEADDFAAVHYKSGALQQALKRLSVNNLSNLMPHPLYVFVRYSHPPLLERLNNIGRHHQISGDDK